MCQPKPGPRCSAHARTNLEARRAAKEAAETTRAEAQAAFRACDPADATTREALRDAAVAADKTYWDATRAHTEALREYETTPEGLEALEQAAARFDEEGNKSAADEVRRRHETARATREMQVADLAMSRRMAARLANPTPDELAALDQTDAEVADLNRAVQEKTIAYEEAQAALNVIEEERRAADRADAAVQRAVTEAMEDAVAARRAATLEAQRLYEAAGVSPTYSTLYAKDMADTASRPNLRWYERYTDYGPQRAMKVKVKRDGPDREKTLAAKAAAETDEAFQAANARLVEAAQRLQAAKDAAAQTRQVETGPVRERRQRAQSAAATARYEMEDTINDRNKAVTRSQELRARIGSGLGVASPSTVDMQRLRDEVVRNPDGTTNAYVYNEPSDGFPHGRYIPAIGVTTVHGMAPANALVLENGQKAWLHGHYARTLRGAGESQSGYRTLVLTAPQEGATPLRREGVENAGFYTFIDSSD